ncbi:MAG: gephyrin-like molybdotransferase Glp [Candidatus Limnocylindria bacterium]
MLSVEAALERLLAGVAALPAERLPLAACLGRFAAERVVAAAPVPPFTNSSMDGYAVRGADLPGAMRVVGEVRAGTARETPLEAGTAVRIMTGAPLPPGADTVVPQEVAAFEGGWIHVNGEAPSAGGFVRQAGEDTREGDEILAAGMELTPARIAVLASCGVAAVAVARRPRVTILSTGDELTEPGAPLADGAIYDANTPALEAAVREAGAEPVSLERAGDDPQLIEDRVAGGAAGADAMVISGGVSVGEHDHVRGAIERLGSLEFWRINVQPGKPLAFGRVRGTPVFGLPGNPVSALVTFELFVRPMLRRLEGAMGDGRPHVRARAVATIAKDPSRRAYLRVRLHAAADGYEAAPAGGQSSGQLRPLADANALLVVPEGEPSAEPGRWYDAVVMGHLP